MESDYVGPEAQSVPIGWFREAIEVAQRAAPGGYALTIQLYDNGFEVVARSGERTATERLTFFDMAMEAERGNPFLLHIERVISTIR